MSLLTLEDLAWLRQYREPVRLVQVPVRETAWC